VNEIVVRIANRHIARCLSQIDQVHNLPDLCADAVRKEMHFCAEDVAEAIQQGASNDTDGNR